MSEREREMRLLPREKEKWENKKKTEKTWDEDWKRRHMQQYVEQPREWKMKRLEKRTLGTIRGATNGVGNEKPKRPKKPRKWTTITILGRGILGISRGFSFIHSI